MLTIREGQNSASFLEVLPAGVLTHAPSHSGRGAGSEVRRVDFDAARFYSYPSGAMRAQGDTYPVDMTKDLRFNFYSTFAGKVDWKFTHKNHFYVVVIPLWTSRTTTLSRDIVRDGNPIHAGAVVQGELHAFEVAPGYRIRVRRKRRNAQ